MDKKKWSNKKIRQSKIKRTTIRRTTKHKNTQPSKVEEKLKEYRSNKRGRECDRMVLEVIRNYPGLSQYELAKKLKSSIGLVDGSIRRLTKQKSVFIQVLERNGRTVNLVYPKEQKPSNLLEVPAQLLKTGNPLWAQSAFIYALDSTTIGISGKEMPEWNEISCLQEEIPLRKDEGKIILTIPERFSRFYNLERKHRIVSINGNNILVTVSGDIVEQKKYPS